MIPQNINQFAQTSQQGQIDLPYQGPVFSCQVVSTQVVPLVPGQAVKLVDVGGGVMKVAALASDSDVPFGFVVLNLKDSDYSALKFVEIATQGGVMWMTSAAAIARGANVQVSNADQKVATSAGVNPVAGVAFDKATAADQLIRVYVSSPALTGAASQPQVITNVVTLAEINAGKILVPVPAGKKAIVTNFVARVIGAFTTGTSVDLLVGATNVASLAQAQLTNGAVLTPNSAGVTLGAGFGAAGVDDGDITVAKTGANFAGGTSVTFTVTYALINA